MKTRFALVAASVAAAIALALPATTHAQNGEWEYWTSFTTPESSSGIIRMAADSQGTLYLSQTAAPIQIVHKSTDAIGALFDGDEPTYSILYQNNDLANGFQGIAIDSDDNVYLSGEWNGENPGEVLKFDAAGNPVTDFGTNGVLTLPNEIRFTGITLTSDEATLIATTFGGVLYSIDAATGAEAVQVADSATGNFLRDIVVRPIDGGDDEIYGNVTSRLWLITGGSATDLSGYTNSVNLTPGLPESNPQSFSVRPTLTYFAADDTVIFGNVNDDASAVYVWDPVEEEIAQTITQWGDPAVNLVQTSGIAAFHAAEDPDSGAQYDLLFVAQFGNQVAVYRKELPTSVEDWTILH